MSDHITHEIDAFELALDVLDEAAPPTGLNLPEVDPLVRHVLRSEGASDRWDVSVVLVDDDRLRSLHRQFMGLDTETDVLTFPHDEPGGTQKGGDVVVSVDRAADQASAFGHTAAEEARFLIVHGLLHLCGWHDATDADRRRMLSRQSALLASFEPVREEPEPA